MEGENNNDRSGDGQTLELVGDILSHDLSNILVTAQSSLELAQRTGDEEHFERTAILLENSQNLVDDVAHLARTGRSIKNCSSTDFSTVVQQAWTTVETPETSLTVETDGTIYADKSRLRQLLENLLRNAIEHNDGEITITAGMYNQPSQSGFYIADDGTGIESEDYSRIFDSGYSTKADQTGIGLAIVHRIVDQHGWQLDVAESSAGGARFDVLVSE